MSTECNKSALDAGKLASKIYATICNSEDEQIQFAGDSLIRVLVYMAKCNEWDFEKLESETLKGLKYYYENEKIN